MITAETKDKILEATRIEEVIGDFVQLRKRGVSLIGLCPFHNEKTPSFNVSVSKGIFKCFGCGKGGDAVSFLMEHERFSYPEALRYLAEKYQIEVQETKPSPQEQQALDERESLFAVNGFARDYFKQQLKETDEGRHIGLSYLTERGFSPSVIEKFQLGYCPNQWDLFSRYALKNGYKKDILVKASLSRIKDQQIYDLFRGRIIFPIHNLSGRVLGFGARILGQADKRPKYLNSAENEIYHKSHVLYGLFFAKTAMSAQNNCYLVEGYTDVLALAQAGIENVLASSGTALTTEQIKLIKRYTPNISLLFDSDKAGIRAAFRGIDMILQEGLNVRIVLFPEGHDPDSFAREKRPSELKAFLENKATDFITFKTGLLLEETGNDPIARAALIREIATTIALVPEPIARSLYTQKCAELMNVAESLLVTEVNKIRRLRITQQRQKQQREDDFQPESFATDTSSGHSQTTQAGQSAGRAELQNPILIKEREVIRLLLLYANQNVSFDRDIQNEPIEAVSMRAGDFLISEIQADGLKMNDSACAEIFELFSGITENEDYPEIRNMLPGLGPEAYRLAVDLASVRYSLSPNWEKMHQIITGDEESRLAEVLHSTIYDLKLRILDDMLEQNRKKLLEAEGRNDAHDQVLRLLEENQRLKTSHTIFANALNRIITR